MPRHSTSGPGVYFLFFLRTAPAAKGRAQQYGEYALRTDGSAIGRPSTTPRDAPLVRGPRTRCTGGGGARSRDPGPENSRDARRPLLYFDDSARSEHDVHSHGYVSRTPARVPSTLRRDSVLIAPKERRECSKSRATHVRFNPLSPRRRFAFLNCP